ncbi:MAG: hypothetical protein CO129_10485, partial [Ignavibacteriales bacterium CG_4_9_14_3_um_filter_34_10]
MICIIFNFYAVNISILIDWEFMINISLHTTLYFFLPLQYFADCFYCFQTAESNFRIKNIQIKEIFYLQIKIFLLF